MANDINKVFLIGRLTTRPAAEIYERWGSGYELFNSRESQEESRGCLARRSKFL